jgi:haloalkane dehalogenase
MAGPSRHFGNVDTDTTKFIAQPLRFAQIDHTRIAYRKFGKGPALILLHGFPFSSLTYRHLVPHLQRHFTCYALDTPGCGASEWHKNYNFHFQAQADTLRRFVDTVDAQSYTVVGHDSGATLARLLTLGDPGRVERLVLLNTEIPGHRPPWIPLYAALARIPGSTELLRPLFRWRRYLESCAAFGQVFSDRNRLDDDFFRCVVDPIVKDRTRWEGVRRYLLGFDWDIVDNLRAAHPRISAPVLMIWGADDPFFPLGLARDMAKQFSPAAQLSVIDSAKLLVHEERPDQVAAAIVDFCSRSKMKVPTH